MKNRIAAIGTFDGVHRGHRSVLEVMSDYAEKNDMEAVAVTFSRHPLALIDASRTPAELTPLWKKKKLLQEAGATPIVFEFDEKLRNTESRELIRELRDNHGVRALVVGYDNTFGSDGLNMSLDDYRRIGKEEGVEVLTAQEVKGVSSSAIRKAVEAGEVEKAAEMLGRPFSITGTVEKGHQLGHTMGFPTANINPAPETAIPKNGVYAAIVKTLDDGVKHQAMVYVGTKPTLRRGDALVVESHLIDWKGDLYGKPVTVRFLKRIRPEKIFDSIDALKRQMNEDLTECRTFFETE